MEEQQDGLASVPPETQTDAISEDMREMREIREVSDADNTLVLPAKRPCADDQGIVGRRVRLRCKNPPFASLLIPAFRGDGNEAKPW